MKKQLILILCLSFMLVFVGCSKDNSNKNGIKTNKEKNNVTESKKIKENNKEKNSLNNKQKDSKNTIEASDNKENEEQKKDSNDEKIDNTNSNEVTSNENNDIKKENEKNYMGKWQIDKYIFAGIGIYSEDDVKAFIGKTVEFTNENANYFQEKRANEMKVLKNPIYKENQMSVEEYLNGYKLSNDVVGLNGNTVNQIQITDENGNSVLSLVKDDNRLFIHLPGVFLELKKVM